MYLYVIAVSSSTLFRVFHVTMFIFFKSIPSQFNYLFGFCRDIQPKETNRSYAKFSGLWLNKSYRFQIVSANDEGNSSASSVVFVPRIPKGFCKTVMVYACKYV